MVKAEGNPSEGTFLENCHFPQNYYGCSGIEKNRSTAASR